MTETVITNARIVLADRQFLGTLCIRNGHISDVSESRSTLSAAHDYQGDYLLPGCVELHTDNLEKHISPRSNAAWPPKAAMFSHAAQMAQAGITTVFNALSLGDIALNSARKRSLPMMLEALSETVASGRLKADHYLHLRCEVCFPQMLEGLERHGAHPLLRILSLMNHTPGERQFASLAACWEYYKGKYGFDDTEMQDFVDRSRVNDALYSQDNRNKAIHLAQERQCILASHDDENSDHVAEAKQDGIVISEFPTTQVAAQAARTQGIRTLLGGPNIVLGGSHSGNVSATALAQAGLVDIISSDYVPQSLIMSAFYLSHQIAHLDLCDTVRMISKTPAETVGLFDRGEITPGRRADVIRVHMIDHQPIVVSTNVLGERVC